MVISLLNTFVFDMDGTLLTIPINYKELKKELSQLLKRKVISINGTLRSLKEENNPLLGDAFNVIDKYELMAFDNVTIYEDSYELLEFLKSHNKKICLVTLQGSKITNKIVNTFFKDFFDVIVTREKSLYREEQIKYALRKINITNMNVVFFIGDSKTDIDAYKKLGCKFRLINRSFSTISFIRKIKLKIYYLKMGVKAINNLKEIIFYLKHL